MKDKKLEILYEDNHLLVVVKPCNVLSQSDNTKDKDLLTMLKEYIKEKYNKPGNVFLGLIHRLDRPVSGVMVYAKTSKAASRLTESMKKNLFQKKYYAIVYNELSKDNDDLEDYLKKLPTGNSVVTNERNGKYAKLNYKVVKRKEDKTLLDIELVTGRHHQIRVQLASRNNPICGDQRYGKQDKTQIALHSYQLTFPHPITKEMLTFTKNPEKKDYWTKFTL